MNSALKGNAQNIVAYELLPDLHRDPFVIFDYVPPWLEWWGEWKDGKSQGFPGICNKNCKPISILLSTGYNLRSNPDKEANATF